jgi:hypothetical protein
MNYLYIGIYLLVAWGWVFIEMARAKRSEDEEAN